MNFTLSELATLIRLVDLEDSRLHRDIQSDVESISDDAADQSVHVGKLSGKLADLYQSQWSDDSNHPPYEELVD